MGRIREAWNALRGKASSNPVIATYEENPWLTQTESRMAGNFSAMLRAYLGWTYICVHKNGLAVAHVPLRLYAAKSRRGVKLDAETRPVARARARELFSRKDLRKWTRKADAENIEEIVEHPFIDLMDLANPQENGQKLIYRIVMYLQLTGNNYWWVRTDGLGVPVELWTLSPDKVKPVVGESGTELITGYEYTTGATKRRIPADEVVHFMQPNPRSMAIGWGNLAGASNEADIMALMNQYEKSLFENHARPDVAFIVPGELDKAVEARMMKGIRRRFGGAKKSGNYALLQGGADVKPISFPPRELAFLQGRKAVRDMICAAFGVPLSQVVTEDVNLANAKAGEVMYARHTIRPLCTLIQEEINERLCPMYSDNLFCAFDDPVPEDEAGKLAAREVNLRTGYTTINEERMTDGLPPVEWGDVPIMPFSMAPLGTEQPEPTSVEQPEKALKARSRFTIRSRIRADQAAFERALPPVANFFERYFTEQERAILPVLEKSAILKTAEEMLQVWEFSLDDWKRRLAREFAPIYKGIMLMNGERILRRLPAVGIAFDVASPGLTKHVETYLPRLANQVNDSLGEVLRGEIAASMSAGETLWELRKRVEGVFDDRRDWEAMRIARTETKRGMMVAQEESFMQSGVVKGKEWRTTSAAPCDFCLALDGRVMGLGDAYFSQGEAHEAGTARQVYDYEPIYRPPLHPNCVLPGTMIASDRILAKMRATYSGPVVEIALANGARLSVTPNHMILTMRGFVPAQFLRKGDNVLYRGGQERVIASYPDNHERPSLIEDIFSAPFMSGGMTTHRVPVAAEYLHGDGRSMKGDIDIETSDSLLRRDGKAALMQRVHQGYFSRTDADLLSLAREGDLTAMFIALGRTADSNVSISREALPFFWSKPRGSDLLSVGTGSTLNASLAESATDHGSGYGEFEGQCEFTGPSKIFLDNGGGVDCATLTTRRDARTPQMVIDRCGIASNALGDLLGGLAGLVTTNEIVHVRHLQYEGNVYDLSTLSTLYTANGILSSNCQCILLEVL